MKELRMNYAKNVIKKIVKIFFFAWIAYLFLLLFTGDAPKWFESMIVMISCFLFFLLACWMLYACIGLISLKVIFPLILMFSCQDPHFVQYVMKRELSINISFDENDWKDYETNQFEYRKQFETYREEHKWFRRLYQTFHLLL